MYLAVKDHAREIILETPDEAIVQEFWKETGCSGPEFGFTSEGYVFLFDSCLNIVFLPESRFSCVIFTKIEK